MNRNLLLSLLNTKFEEDFFSGVDIDRESKDLIINGTSYNVLKLVQNDPEMLESIKLEWLESIKSTSDEYILEISDIHLNKPRIYDLKRDIKMHDISPFIGSGMFKASQFPLWGELLSRLRNRVGMSQKEFKKLLNAGNYESIASELVRLLGKDLDEELLLAEFGIRYKGGHVAINGPIRFLPYIFSDFIITTNYDDIIEELYKSYSIVFERLLGTRIEDYGHLKRNGSKLLLKLHGDLNYPRSRILTSEEYENSYVKDPKFTIALRDIYRSHRLLFIGCSLGEDRTLKVFEAVSSDLAVSHYAFLPAPDDLRKFNRPNTETRKKDAYLYSIGIRVIWYKGEPDESIEKLMIFLMSSKGVI